MADAGEVVVIELDEFEIAEARRLRRDGWSIWAIAERLRAGASDVAAAVGETLPNGRPPRKVKRREDDGGVWL